MDPNLHDRATATWARYFGLSHNLVEQPGTTLIEHADLSESRWQTLFIVGRRIVLRAAPGLKADLQAMLADLPDDHRLTVDDIKAYDWQSRQVKTDSEIFYVLDPAEMTRVPAPDGITVRLLNAQDQAAFTSFESACSAEDWDEGDIALDHLMAVGAFDGGRIVAAASIYDWCGFLDVGVITDPAYRGRKLGQVVVSHIAPHFFEDGRVLFYRHEVSNPASGGIAKAVGYSFLAEVASFRLVD